MNKSIFGLVSTQTNAQKIVDRLLSVGFEREDISLLYPNTNQNTNVRNVENVRNAEPPRVTVESQGIRRVHGTPVTDTPIVEKTKAPEGAVTGVTTGGILGGSLGLLAGIGALSIPGLGPFIAAGPLMAALSGTAVGGSLGLLIGALIGAGIPEFEAKKYENALKSGKILVSVYTHTEEEFKRANDVFKKEGATDISVSREKTGTAL